MSLKFANVHRFTSVEEPVAVYSTSMMAAYNPPNTRIEISVMLQYFIQRSRGLELEASSRLICSSRPLNIETPPARILHVTNRTGSIEC